VAIGGGTPSFFQNRRTDLTQLQYPTRHAFSHAAMHMLWNVDGTNRASSGIWMVLWNVALRDLN
jgi:hypothetical protein